MNKNNIKNKIKSAGSAVGDAALFALDLSAIRRAREIDLQIAELQAERDKLMLTVSPDRRF